ncbi:MAG TPA: hypothetical protein VH349_10450 [Ktedonobacterales bacterium]|jgi:hypothetical protein
MEPLTLVGVFFASAAVIITVVGQFMTIMEYVHVKPTPSSPIVALLGVVALIILGSAIIAINVVPGSNTLDSANTIGEIAFAFSFIPNLWATVQAWIWGYRKASVLLAAIVVTYFILIYPARLFGYLPSNIPLVVAGVFAFLPIAFSYFSATGKSQT